MAAERITEAQLAAALKGMQVTVEDGREGAEGTLRHPDGYARDVFGLVGEQYRADGAVSVDLQRDDLLQFTGWVNAHLPEGDWCPGFVTRFVLAAEKAVKRDE